MTAAKPRLHYAWLILIGCCFMQAGGLGAVLDAAGVFFVPVCDDLGFTRSELSLYLTFYFIATVFAMPLVGKWITKYNVNRVLSVSFALVVAAEAAMGSTRLKATMMIRLRKWTASALLTFTPFFTRMTDRTTDRISNATGVRKMMGFIRLPPNMCRYMANAAEGRPEDREKSRLLFRIEGEGPEGLAVAVVIPA